MTLTLLGASLPKIGEAFTATNTITAESIEKNIATNCNPQVDDL
jgi:hypothetical protein